MEAELKGKWITALRSGEFKQARARLKKGDSYCCLGVLAILNDPNADLRDEEGENDVYNQLDRMVGGLDNRTALVVMNDTEGKSFPEIADWVEQNLPALAQDERQ